MSTNTEQARSLARLGDMKGAGDRPLISHIFLSISKEGCVLANSHANA